jgi:hypothetical protein
MSFGDAILAGFRQYAEFGGRAGVAELLIPIAGLIVMATPDVGAVQALAGGARSRAAGVGGSPQAFRTRS